MMLIALLKIQYDLVPTSVTKYLYVDSFLTFIDKQVKKILTYQNVHKFV